ncbi:hypothetical protein CRYUN_Cryun14cG0027600 [Craigia yunnanensis]
MHMNSEMAISVESSINTAYAGVTVLLVDGDSSCLTILSKMYHRFGYKGKRKCGSGLVAKEISGTQEESSLENASIVDAESQPLISEGRQNIKSEKRKRSNEMENHLEEDNDDSAALKKPKLIWTDDELHNRFLQAIKVLSIDGAHPKKILQHMSVPGLKKENVSSHLQENLNGHMPITSLASAYLLKHVDSNHNDASTIKFEQQTLCNEQLYSTYPECNQIGDRVTNNEGMVDFHQIENSEQFLEGETDLLNIGDSGLESLSHCPTLFDGSLQEKQQTQQQSVLPEPLQLPLPQEQENHDVPKP